MFGSILRERNQITNPVIKLGSFLHSVPFPSLLKRNLKDRNRFIL